VDIFEMSTSWSSRQLARREAGRTRHPLENNILYDSRERKFEKKWMRRIPSRGAVYGSLASFSLANTVNSEAIKAITRRRSDADDPET